jgi:hypothetical protein
MGTCFPGLNGVALGMVVAATTVVAGAHLKPETQAGWRAYVAAVENRRATERHQRGGFLVLDFLPGAAAERGALAAGAVLVEPMPAAQEAGREVTIPSGLAHHWRGAVLIGGVDVPGLLSRIEHADPPAVQQDVVSSAVLARGPGTERVYLRLRRTKIVTAVFDTEHAVTFDLLGPSRAESASVATKIAELRDVGTAAERALPLGDDRGFLWALNAYWRYEAVPGGVIAECESLTLTRTVPLVFRYLAGPLIDSAARESMQRTLEALRTRYEVRPLAPMAQ